MANEHKKIILVEDNKAEADLTKIVCRDLKIESEILHFSDGEELLIKLPALPLAQISYILLDLNMPRVNGYQVLQKLSTEPNWKKLPVIVFSSSTSENDVNTCYDLGANAYVTKPMDINKLTQVIQSIHSFWGQTNVGPYFD